MPPTSEPEPVYWARQAALKRACVAADQGGQALAEEAGPGSGEHQGGETGLDPAGPGAEGAVNRVAEGRDEVAAHVEDHDRRRQERRRHR